MGLGGCPCKVCTTETGRSTTCHSNCKKYIDWKQKLNELNTIKREQIDKEVILWKYKRKHR